MTTNVSPKHELLLEQAKRELAVLGNIYDSYYKADKSRLLSLKSNDVMKILNEIEIDIQQDVGGLQSPRPYVDPQLQSQLAYIRGACLHFASLDDKQNACQSEMFLSRAVKLDPTNGAAWVALGGCLCKKGKKEEAYNCFYEAVKQAASYNASVEDKVSGKEALRDLSILTRQLPSTQNMSTVLSPSSSIQGATNVEGSIPTTSATRGGIEAVSTIDESIQLAKKAIQLDLHDHKSWYVLGNAHTHRYFASPLQDMTDLTKALTSYRRAESLPGGSENPDLYYNRGNVQRYLLLFDEAVASYRRAVELDESFVETVSAVKRILAFQALVLEKARDSSHKMQLDIKMAKDELVQPTFLKCVGIKDLQLGQNTQNIAVKVLQPLLIDSDSSGGTPICFLCADKDGNVTVLAIYNVGTDTPSLLKDQVLSISEPFIRPISTSKPESVKIIMVLSIAHLKINGKSSKRIGMVPPRIVSENR